MLLRTLEAASGIFVVYISLGDLPLYPNMNYRPGSTDKTSLLKVSRDVQTSISYTAGQERLTGPAHSWSERLSNQLSL